MIKILKNTPIYQICLGLMIGIILGEIYLGILVILFIILLLLYFTKLKFIFLILFLIAGVLYVKYWDQLINKDINTYLDTKEELIVEVIEDPIPKDYTQEVTIKPLKSNIFILAEFDKYLDLSRGDQLTLKGEITRPKQSPFFDRTLYLKSRKILLELKNPKILSIKQDPLNFNTNLTKVKQKLSSILEYNTTEPQTTLAKGLIIGDDSNFSEEFKNNLKNSGLSHITSVSGYNVGIIFAGILLLNKFFNRKYCLMIGIFLIFIFWQIVGSNNLPTERATIMLSLYSLALLSGRKLNLFYVILLSTLFVLIEYPYYLYNVSFQLSLGAIMGILILTPRIIKILEKKKLKNLVTEIIAVTVSVIIFTMPISILTFGQTSSLSIVSNILVLPLIPILTLLLILGLGLSIVQLATLSQMIFLISNYLLKIIIYIVNSIGSLSFASISNPKIIVIFFILITLPTILFILKNKNVQ